jgi:hypothetical protein
MVKSLGGPILATPKIIPIFFPSDPDADALTTFLGKLPVSAYWKEITHEYGIGATTTGAPITVANETAPGVITDPQVKTWLASHLDGAAADWGTPDPNAVYVVFYPSTTTFSIDGAMSCRSLGAYHSMTTIGKTDVTYAVIGRCPLYQGLSGLDVVTAGTSHELIEAVTDPSSDKAAFSAVDDDHVVWEAQPGAEVADMCDTFSGVYFAPPDLGFTVERVWSNARAAAGHHPCIPAIDGEVYFNAIPTLTDAVDMTPGPGATKGISVPIGKTKVVDVALLSDAPTSGPWTVDVKVVGENPPSLDLSLDKKSGVNGDKLKLTIKRKDAGSLSGGSVIVATSTLGKKKNIWMGYVSD